MTIRPAIADDVEAVAAIYAHHVLHGTGTFEEVPPTVHEMAARMAAVTARGWPWLVAEEAGAVAGYAYAGIFRDRSAYRHSGETSLYLGEDAIGRGLGGALLDALMAASVTSGFHRLFAVIGDSANAASIGVHASRGFVECGRLDDAGLKFGRKLDVVFMQRALVEAR